MPPRRYMSKSKCFFQDLDPNADSLYPDHITLGTLLGQIKQRSIELIPGGPSLSVQNIDDPSDCASIMGLSEGRVGKPKAPFSYSEPISASLLPQSDLPPKTTQSQVMPPRLCMSKRTRFFQDLNPDATPLYPDDITLGPLLNQSKQRRTDLVLDGPSLSVQNVDDLSDNAPAIGMSETQVGKRKATFCEVEPIGESFLPKSFRPPKKQKHQVIPTQANVSKRKRFFEALQLDTEYDARFVIGSDKKT